MKYEDFIDEYTKLHEFFYHTTKPDVRRMEECYGLLKMLPLSKFQRACQQIKQDEDTLPRNIVSYVNRRVDYQDEHRATGGNGNHGEFCWACQNTGFITCSMRTGGPIRFPTSKNCLDNTFVKTCVCPCGQHMAQGSGGRPATQEECREAAMLNGGPQKQIYMNERKAERLMNMKQFDPPESKLLQPSEFPEKCPF